MYRIVIVKLLWNMYGTIVWKAIRKLKRLISLFIKKKRFQLTRNIFEKKLLFLWQKYITFIIYIYIYKIHLNIYY